MASLIAGAFRRQLRRRDGQVREMPPRPQGTRQSQRDELPQLRQPQPYPFQAAMSGPVNPKYDPCGAGPLKAGDKK